jgi:hypothetical protein
MQHRHGILCVRGVIQNYVYGSHSDIVIGIGMADRGNDALLPQPENQQ